MEPHTIAATVDHRNCKHDLRGKGPVDSLIDKSQNNTGELCQKRLEVAPEPSAIIDFFCKRRHSKSSGTSPLRPAAPKPVKDKEQDYSPEYGGNKGAENP